MMTNNDSSREKVLHIQKLIGGIKNEQIRINRSYGS